MSRGTLGLKGEPPFRVAPVVVFASRQRRASPRRRMVEAGSWDGVSEGRAQLGYMLAASDRQALRPDDVQSATGNLEHGTEV